MRHRQAPPAGSRRVPDPAGPTPPRGRHVREKSPPPRLVRATLRREGAVTPGRHAARSWRARPAAAGLLVAPLGVLGVTGAAVAVGLPLVSVDDAPPAPPVVDEVVPEQDLAVPDEVDLPAEAVAAAGAQHDVQPATGRLQAARSVVAAEVPPVALAAYQRAEAVIDLADPTCGLRWTVLAAVGQLESGHGERGGGVVTAAGLSRPALVGPSLDGRHGRALMRDTDAGVLDGDPAWDAPVGPFGLLPSTWSAVAVDSDGDGEREPQDVDDAALAVAVLLCDGALDLSDTADLSRALGALDPRPGYAATVVALAAALEDTGLPAGTTPPDIDPTELPALPDLDDPGAGATTPADEPATGPQGSTLSPSTGPSTGPSTEPSTEPSTPAPTTPTTSVPVGESSATATESSSSPSSASSSSASESSSDKPSGAPTGSGSSTTSPSS